MRGDREIAVVTHPLGTGGHTAVESLLDVIAPHANPTLVCAELDENSDIRDQYDYAEVGVGYPSQRAPVLALVYVINQLLLAFHVLRRNEPTVLFFGSTTYLAPIVVAKLAGKRVALEPRGNLAKSFYISFVARYPAVVASTLSGTIRLLERIGFRVADFVITLSPSMAIDLGLDPNEPSVLPRGAWYIDLERFAVTTPIENRSRAIAFIGRFETEKGIDRMVTTTKELSMDVDVTFVGDGSKRDAIETELAERIDGGQVSIHGWVDHEELPAVFNDHRLLVLPSRTEGLPITVLEGFGCGVPAAATAVAGVPDIVVDDETGLLFEDFDAEAVANAIEGAIDEDVVDYSRNARSLVETEYSRPAAVDRYNSIIRTICPKQ